MKIKILQDVIDILRGKKKINIKKSERKTTAKVDCCLSETEKVMMKFNYSIPTPPEGEQFEIYAIELMTSCSLRCGLCPQVNKNYQRENQMMSLELFIKIIDKMKKESPSARIFPYGYCEPFLHPQLPEMLQELRKRDFRFTISSNLNKLIRLEEVLLAEPNSMEISVSGFFQDTYKKAHIGGDIEKVKENMKILRETIDRLNSKIEVNIIYHMYKDNLGDDYKCMKEFTEGLGFNFFPTWARAIAIEDIIKYMRENNLSRYNGPKEEWINEIPLPKEFYENMERCVYLPQDYTSGAWKDVHVEVDKCPYYRLGLNIHSDGRIRMCGASYDDRYLVGPYLDTPIDEIYEMRKKSILCKECYANNLSFFTGYVGIDEIHKNTANRLEKEYAHIKLGGV